MKQKSLSDLYILLSNDPKLFEQFQKNPQAFLEEQGVKWSDPRALKVLHETADTTYFVLRRPSDITDEFLTQAQLPENYHRLLSQLAQSPELRKEFKANPQAILKKFQIEVPQGKKIQVLEDTDQITYWVFPDFSELSEEQLAAIAGGIGPIGQFLDKAYNVVGPFVAPLTFLLSPALLVENIVDATSQSKASKKG